MYDFSFMLIMRELENVESTRFAWDVGIVVRLPIGEDMGAE
jgi:hypothetical protein